MGSAGEHQSNGTAEEAGKMVRDHARVLKIDLQTKIKREIAVDEPIMPWLIRWAAMNVSRFHVGRDGKTAYHKQIGRKCGVEVAPIWGKNLVSQPKREPSEKSFDGYAMV